MIDTTKLIEECAAEAATREECIQQDAREVIIAAAQRLLCCGDMNGDEVIPDTGHEINIFPWRLDCKNFLTDGAIHMVYRPLHQRWSAVYHCESCHEDTVSSWHCSALKPLIQDWFGMKHAHKCQPAPVKFFAGTAEQVEQKSKHFYQQGFRLHTLSFRGDEFYACFELSRR